MITSLFVTGNVRKLVFDDDDDEEEEDSSVLVALSIPRRSQPTQPSTVPSMPPLTLPSTLPSKLRSIKNGFVMVLRWIWDGHPT